MQQPKLYTGRRVDIVAQAGACAERAGNRLIITNGSWSGALPESVHRIDEAAVRSTAGVLDPLMNPALGASTPVGRSQDVSTSLFDGPLAPTPEDLPLVFRAVQHGLEHGSSSLSDAIAKAHIDAVIPAVVAERYQELLEDAAIPVCAPFVPAPFVLAEDINDPWLAFRLATTAMTPMAAVGGALHVCIITGRLGADHRHTLEWMARVMHSHRFDVEVRLEVYAESVAFFPGGMFEFEHVLPDPAERRNS